MNIVFKAELTALLAGFSFDVALGYLSWRLWRRHRRGLDR